MTTYTECQAEPTAENLWSVPTHYDLRLVCPAGAMGYVECADETQDSFVVTDIPANVRPSAVALHLRGISIVWHPDILVWSAVADLHVGTLLHARRDGRVVSIGDASHWSGRRAIGWMRDAA